jgi:hypothetical protein
LRAGTWIAQAVAIGCTHGSTAIATTRCVMGVMSVKTEAHAQSDVI